MEEFVLILVFVAFTGGCDVTGRLVVVVVTICKSLYLLL